jgi:flagellar basal-body rod protein FlgB
VSFEGALKNALKEAKAPGSLLTRQASNDEQLPMRVTHAAHIPLGNGAMSLNDVQPTITENDDLEYRNDGNSVDVETEMVQLAKNTQHYNAVAHMESSYFKGLRSIITGGGS